MGDNWKRLNGANLWSIAYNKKAQQLLQNVLLPPCLGEVFFCFIPKGRRETDGCSVSKMSNDFIVHMDSVNWSYCYSINRMK
jgi:hypothetical protein